ncbi:MAG: protein kinase [Deltaproteobacteria bacterium]|nr:protein kinase [Deltaproteobacteria bacterium]
MALSVQLDLSNTTVGPYRVRSPLGEGGMGVVFRAEHLDTGQVVALKTLKLLSEKMLAGFRREVHALSRIAHPGVVKIYGHGVDHGMPWYAMELLEGLTLHTFNLRRWGGVLAEQPTVPSDNAPKEHTEAPEPSGELSERATADVERPSEAPGGAPAWSGERPLSDPGAKPPILRPAAGGALQETLQVIRRLCTTLSYLHGEGIVHRDLKPENVFLRPDGTPVVVDFGLVSRFVGRSGRDSLEVAGAIMGTIAYMAPEQIRGELVDARADLYSLGCMLYELVTGRVPFLGTSTMEVVGKQLLSTPTPPSSLVTGVPPALDELILRLMAKQPRDRLGHADDVAQALGTLAGPWSPPEDWPRARSYLYRPSFVGREPLLDELRRHLSLLREAKGAMVFLGGESGVGKTRIAAELGRAAQAVNLRVVAGECLPVNTADDAGTDFNGAPLHPLGRFLNTVADVCRARGPEATQRLLGRRARVLGVHEPSLLALPGVESEPEPPVVPAEAALQRLLEALRDTLGAFADDGPWMLLLDDLQWVDELTLQFLGSLGEAFFAQFPVLLVGTYRTEEAPRRLLDLVSSPGASRYELDRLDADTVGALVGGMLALTTPPEGFVKFLSRESKGNPFLVAEYLRTAVAEGFLSRDGDGRWAFTRAGQELTSYDAIPLPRSVRDLVSRRLEGLSASARGLVELCAVLGRDVDTTLLGPVLASLGETPEHDREVLESLKELLARHVLEESNEAEVLRFVHDKFREVTYTRVPDGRRRELHRAVAGALEAQHARTSAFSVRYRVLAHHWSRAAVWPKAVEYLEKAGEQALAAFSNREAVAFYAELLALHTNAHVQHGDPVAALPGGADGRLSLVPGGGHLDQGPAPKPSDLAVGDLRLGRWEKALSEAHLRLGDLTEGRAHAERALSWCGHPMPRTTAGMALALLGQIILRVLQSYWPRRFVARDPEEGARLLEAAHVSNRLLEVFLYANQPVPGVYSGLRNLNLAERVEPSSELARGYAMMCIVVGATPLHRVAEAWAQRALEITRARTDASARAYALSRVSVWWIQSADWKRVEEALLDARRIATQLGDKRQLEECLGIHGNAYQYQGRFEEASGAWREVFASARQRGDAQVQGWARIGEASALLRLGRAREALALLEPGLALVEQSPAATDVPWALGMLALARLRLGDVTQAAAEADRALRRMTSERPVVYYVQCAVAALPEVFLMLWEEARTRGDTRALATSARRSCRLLSGYAFMFPFARPGALLCAAMLSWAEGARPRALRGFARAAEAARAAGMPYEEAQARLQLARHEPAARAAEASAALALFERLGARDDAERARALMEPK